MAKPIKLWRGYHGPEIKFLIEEAWRGKSLLILYPPHVIDTRCLSALPQGPIQFVGDWPNRPSLNVEAHGAPFVEEPVFGIFSTGTSGGQPRLILYSKENIQSTLDGIRSLFDLNRMIEIFCFPQPFHTFGLVLGYVHQIEYQMNWVPIEGSYHSSQHRRWIESLHPNRLTLGTPTHFQDLLQVVGRQKVTSSYSCIVGGAPVKKSLWLSLRERLQIEMPSIGYGATEASPGISHLAPGVEPLEDAEVGHVLAHVALALNDDGITFKGPNLCLAIVEEGRIQFPTSLTLKDVLKRRSDGSHVLLGRQEFVLNRGGEKFHLEVVEQAIFSAVKEEVVAVAVPDDRLGAELGLVVTPSGGQKVAEIYQFLRAQFGRRFDPSRVKEVAEIPQSTSAKIDRQACQRLFEREL